MRIENEILIAAPISTVWDVTCDVERWPDWTPTVISVRQVSPGPFGLGSVARIKQPAQPEADWTVTEWQENRRFAWTTSRWGLRMVGIHELESEREGTQNRLAVEAEGWLAIVLGPLLRPAIARSLRLENAGLKRRCETPDASG